MKETKIFDTALKCLSGIQLIVDNSQLVHLNDEDLLKLHKCLTFKEKFENQTVDVKIALRLCPTEDADESLWFEQKIYHDELRNLQSFTEPAVAESYDSDTLIDTLGETIYNRIVDNFILK